MWYLLEHKRKVNKMWELYDALIRGIPPDCRLDEALAGERWTMAEAGWRGRRQSGVKDDRALV
ncbi:MAG: hypothetical protein LBF83_08775 [Spirochaetaceae bacterium]|jgi:hypothetical protein|nr:hypothetical protein [Spirochaetaceae bacterium]